MYVVYVLYSQKFNKIYIGYTSSLISRFRSHNKLGKGWTKKFRPWIVVLVEFFETKKEAIEKENALKGAKGREWIWNVTIKNNLNDL